MEEPEELYSPAIEAPEAPQSLMEQLRLKRAEIAERRETTMAVPGYGADLPLLVRYRHLDRTEVERVGKRVRGENIRDQGERQMRVMMDMIIAATEGFYVQEPGNEEPTKLTVSDEDKTPITTWPDMAAWLGANGDIGNTPRGSLIFVFANNEFAIGQVGLTLSRWFTNTDIDVDQEMLEG